MCTFYYPLRTKKFTFLSEGTDVKLQQHIHQKYFNLCHIMLLCQSCWIGKNTNNKFSCVMVLIVRPSSNLKFQFVFGFIECLWEIFSLLNFETFWFYIWILVIYFWLLILRYKWLQVTSYLMPMNKKTEYKDQKYILRNAENDLKKKV